MSTLQMAQENHPIHNVPRPTEDYRGDSFVANPDLPDVDSFSDNKDRLTKDRNEYSITSGSKGKDI